MVAPRPDPVPPELREAARLLDWRGPTVSPDELPHFEIAHEPGGRTRYLGAKWGSESQLTFDDIPAGLEPGLAYIVPMLESGRQVEIAERLKARGWTVGCGTYGGATEKYRDIVLRSIELADVFFCNQSEAAALFGDPDRAVAEPGKLLYVTRGERGARVSQGAYATDVPGVPVEELDPTGAGDAFCGTVLAGLAAGLHPVVAARRAVAAAAEMVTGVGPERLLRPGPALEPSRDPRVRVDGARCEVLARRLADEPEASPFDFTGPSFPDEGDPRALDFFFAATLQQFGFWSERDGAYAAPMIARLGGRDLKGSDYLWAAYRRWLEEAPGELAPEGHLALFDDAGAAAGDLAGADAGDGGADGGADVARATRFARFDHRLRDDRGANPLPAGELHPLAARAYARDMTALGWTPADVVAAANATPRPIDALLRRLDRVGGYKEDPLRKKSALLGAILSQRPERWLRPAAGEEIPPIVDYHCMRSCLRLGLVVAEDASLRERLESRTVVTADEERAMREASAEAVRAVQAASGKPMGAVDWFFFQNRRRCPEMTEPDCPACPADVACAHATALFQPVFRTTAY